MYLVGIPLDCGHRLQTTIEEIHVNREGLWWCHECRTGNHVEILQQVITDSNQNPRKAGHFLNTV